LQPPEHEDRRRGHPLLGERAGVRASFIIPSPTKFLSPRHEPHHSQKFLSVPVYCPSAYEALLGSPPHAEILERLGDPVKHVQPSHITGWKKYGYQVWLEEFKRNEALRETHESAAVLLAQKAGVPVQDAGRTLAAAQLYEFIISFNPRAFAAALEDKPELYLRIISTLARLSEGEATCSHYRALDSALEAKRQQGSAASQSNKVISQEALTQVAHQAKLV